MDGATGRGTLPARRGRACAWRVGLLALALFACDDGERDDDRAADEASAPALEEQSLSSADAAERFTMHVVTQGLESPWEITWGPERQLWVTERAGKRVVRVDPATGARATLLDLSSAVYSTSGQDGLLGMALHPSLLRDGSSPYVYLAYTYDADAGRAVARRTKIVRYSYDAQAEALVSPVVLISWLPASHDHNAGRLAFGPDGKLYYSVGDMGKNQFDNKCKVVRAQELPTQREIAASSWVKYQGKVLRLNPDGSIPADNPVLAGVRSHVYTYGHRNAQGLAFGPSGLLYASEHGAKTDDELNRLEPGKNYGWPHVAGYRDDKAYVYGNWSASKSTPCDAVAYDDYTLPSSVPQQRETSWSHPDFMPPMLTFYTVDEHFSVKDPSCAGSESTCWPTIAPSSLDLYVPAGEASIPGWRTSLLVPSLKHGSVYRVELSADGTAVVGKRTRLFNTTNRYRDLTVSPNKRTFYVITDSQGDTSGPTQGSTRSLAHRGAVLAFTYAP